MSCEINVYETTSTEIKKVLVPDSKQSGVGPTLGNGSLGVVGNTSLLTCWHWPNIGSTLKFQQLKPCCWPNVGTSTTHVWRNDVLFTNLHSGHLGISLMDSNTTELYREKKYFQIIQPLHGNSETFHLSSNIRWGTCTIKKGKWPSYDVESHEDDFNGRFRLKMKSTRFIYKILLWQWSCCNAVM